MWYDWFIKRKEIFKVCSRCHFSTYRYYHPKWAPSGTACHVRWKVKQKILLFGIFPLYLFLGKDKRLSLTIPGHYTKYSNFIWNEGQFQDYMEKYKKNNYSNLTTVFGF